MFAIIETGGKQYLVVPKTKIRVEKLSAFAKASADKPADDLGKEVIFDKVLLVSNDQDVKIGRPYVASGKVTATVTKMGRSRKIRIFKYKSKVRYRRRRGHRQEFTEVEIQSIS